MVYEGKIDWVFGELLVLGLLVVEGKLVCLLGQDSCCGIFFQWYLVFIDCYIGEEFILLQLLVINFDSSLIGGKFLVYDLLLLEYVVVGFEYGYIVGNLDVVVFWEVQFGDFVNGVQLIIDEFISFGEVKWG